MTVGELRNRLSTINGNATVYIDDYWHYNIGDIVITISEDGNTTVLLNASRKKTEQPDRL